MPQENLSSTQMGLFSLRRWLDTSNFRFRKQRDCTNLCTEIKGLDQLCAADLRLCFRTFEKQVSICAHMSCGSLKYTMRHKFSNFHLIFKMQIGMKMKWNKIFNPSIFDALAIIMSNFHWNINFPLRSTPCQISQGSRLKSHIVTQYLV